VLSTVIEYCPLPTTVARGDGGDGGDMLIRIEKLTVAALNNFLILQYVYGNGQIKTTGKKASSRHRAFC
jgi:hypothetical protein